MILRGYALPVLSGLQKRDPRNPNVRRGSGRRGSWHYGGVDAPRVNLDQWVIHIDDLQSARILLNQPGKQRAVDARAERTLQVSKADYGDLGRRTPPHRAAAYVNRQVLTDIHGFQPRERLPVFRDQELLGGCVAVSGSEGHGYGVVSGHIAGLGIADRNVDLDGHALLPADLLLNTFHNFRRKWRGRCLCGCHSDCHGENEQRPERCYKFGNHNPGFQVVELSHAY